MGEFHGFNAETNDFLLGISINNNKEWFHAHKDIYTENVHKPIVALGNDLYELMHAYDETFLETAKISRINRDTRFSKNKAPYKTGKWIFMRADGRPDLQYPRPTFFFEIGVNWWRYGMYFAPKPALLGAMRKKIIGNIPRFTDIINGFKGNGSFELEGDMYKRVFYPEAGDELNFWLQRKELTFMHYEPYTNNIVYGEDLPEFLVNEFKKLYPLYKFLDEGL